MPLPDAGDPTDSLLYQQLRSKKLEDLTADQLDQWRDQLFVEGANEDDIRRMILLYLAAGQFSIPSGPMPRTAEMVQITQTSDVGAYTIFKPGVGECWQWMGGDLLTSGGTGKVNFSLFDGTTYAYIGSASVSGQEPLTNDNLDGIIGQLFLTSDVWLVADATTFPTSTRVTAAFIRVS